MTSRRSFLLGLGTVLAAPALVRAESVMRIAALRKSVDTIFIPSGRFSVITLPPIPLGYSFHFVAHDPVRMIQDGKLLAQLEAGEYFQI